MFRFSIRDVLWLTVVVALGVTWWLDRKFLRSDFTNQLRAAQLLQEKAELQQQKTELELLRIHRMRKNEEMQREALLIQEAELKVLVDRKAWAATKAKSKELGAPQPKPITE